MHQVPLKLVPRLRYHGPNFVKHAGVSELCRLAEAMLVQQSFGVISAVGAARSGKTHFAIWLCHQAYAGGRLPTLLSGADFAAWLADERPFDLGRELVVVDDADLYLSKLLPGQSGPFVGFVERLRVAQGMLVLLSSQGLESMPCDEHVFSRIRLGLQQFGPPHDEQVSELLVALALQRGLKLPARCVQFLSRRLRRDVAALEAYLQRLHYLAQVLGKSIKFEVIQDAV